MEDLLIAKFSKLKDRLVFVNELLSLPSSMDDRESYKRLTQEYAELVRLTTTFESYQQIQKELSDLDGMADDDQCKELVAEERLLLISKKEELLKKLELLLVPEDPHDQGNVFLEIRAGTGGQESALFAADLLRMYMRYAERQNWDVEIVSASESELGGYKEVIVRLIGHAVYSRLKFESGGHRVQRIPVTETQGRIHTSACTVAVMPEVKQIDPVLLNPADLRIDTFRASGAGGQHVNRTDSAVRITHLPSGMVAECQDERSQHKNKARAMSVLAARIMDKKRQEQNEKEAAQRKSLIGSGDRSERIRTYNFPQGRVTDHRINVTLYKLEYFLDGDVNEMLDALSMRHQSDQLEKIYQEYQ